MKCNLSIIGSNLTRYILVLIKLNHVFPYQSTISHNTYSFNLKKKNSTQPKIGHNSINVNINPSTYIILNSQNLLEKLAMHVFINKYVQKSKKFHNFLNMQNLKITKNRNNSPTLKINIVLNVQNIKKKLKGLRTSLNGVVSL